jgi:hypothetical protein
MRHTTLALVLLVLAAIAATSNATAARWTPFQWTPAKIESKLLADGNRAVYANQGVFGLHLEYAKCRTPGYVPRSSSFTCQVGNTNPSWQLWSGRIYVRVLRVGSSGRWCVPGKLNPPPNIWGRATTVDGKGYVSVAPPRLCP